MLTVGPRNRRLIPECRPRFVHSAQGLSIRWNFSPLRRRAIGHFCGSTAGCQPLRPFVWRYGKRCSLWDEIWLESATKLVSSLAARSPKPWLALCGGDPSTPSHLHVLKFDSCCFPRNKTLPGSGVGDYTANAGARTPFRTNIERKGGPGGCLIPW